MPIRLGEESSTAFRVRVAGVITNRTSRLALLVIAEGGSGFNLLFLLRPRSSSPSLSYVRRPSPARSFGFFISVPFLEVTRASSKQILSR